VPFCPILAENYTSIACTSHRAVIRWKRLWRKLRI